jgi:hypothetical protein
VGRSAIPQPHQEAGMHTLPQLRTHPLGRRATQSDFVRATAAASTLTYIGVANKFIGSARRDTENMNTRTSPTCAYRHK